MTFEEKAIAYYQYALDLEADGYGGIAFTPSEFFEEYEEIEEQNKAIEEAITFRLRRY